MIVFRVCVCVIILGVLSACDRVAPTSSPTSVRTGLTVVPLLPSVVVTSSNEATSTVATPFPTQPRLTCSGAPTPRLIIQARGRVTDENNDTLNLRNGPGTSFDIIATLNQLDTFLVLDGLTCANGFAWYRVRYGNFVGWLAEGDAELYYVEPYLTG